MPGATLRVQLLARDLIVATRPPQHLSVRNILAGVITAVSGDVDDSDLVAIDIGGVQIMARVTQAATRELGPESRAAGLGAGQGRSLCAGHSFAAPRRASGAPPAISGASPNA